jgi:hypothetical protein
LSFAFSTSNAKSPSLELSHNLDDEFIFPSYPSSGGGGYGGYLAEDTVSPPRPSLGRTLSAPSMIDRDTQTRHKDDIGIREEPSKHVDYLSHEWKEEDIWASWRYIVSKRRLYGEQSRLENAIWRTWVRQKYKLDVVPPETLNWYIHPMQIFYSSITNQQQAKRLRRHLAVWPIADSFAQFRTTQ